MKNNIKVCECCGAKMVYYKHNLSPILIVGLKAINGRGIINLRDLDLDRSVWDNFQKLKYFGLVEKADNSSKGGNWSITEKGMQFLAGKIQIPKSVWTYRGTVVKESELKILISNVKGRTQIRADYISDAIPKVTN